MKITILALIPKNDFNDVTLIIFLPSPPPPLFFLLKQLLLTIISFHHDNEENKNIIINIKRLLNIIRLSYFVTVKSIHSLKKIKFK